MSQKGKRSGKIPSAAKKKRERYLPPRVAFAEIAANEALMGICKGGLGSGPFGPGCGGCKGGGS